MISTAGIFAAIACAGSIGTKWLLAHKSASLERLVTAQVTLHQEAKKELALVVQQQNVLIAEQKKLETKKNTMQHNASRLDKILKELEKENDKLQAVKDRQKELLGLDQKRLPNV